MEFVEKKMKAINACEEERDARIKVLQDEIDLINDKIWDIAKEGINIIDKFLIKLMNSVREW